MPGMRPGFITVEPPTAPPRNFPYEPELAQMACAVLRSLALGVPESLGPDL